MTRTRSIGQKIGAGFALMVLLVGSMATIAVLALRDVSEAKDAVLTDDADNLTLAASMNAVIEEKSSSLRGYILTRDNASLENYRKSRAEFFDYLGKLRQRSEDPEALRILSEVERAEEVLQEGSETLLKQRSADADISSVAQEFSSRVILPMRELRLHVGAFVERQRILLDHSLAEADAGATRSVILLVASSILALLIAIIASWFLTRTLTQQIGAAVQRIQSSSSELQTAANQQASGAKEQSTAMAEITTTINELLTTSRQIADSSQRVAQIAEATARSARQGEHVSGRTSESMSIIKKQVDLIVMHMLDLGKKSQQIGGILDIINELSDQTNILSINAAIEAAGAGEHGRRFGVVAEEVRKLADRVGGSTREIRGLIEEIRAAVNTTIMTTEGGTKAVDAGAREFMDVAAALQGIAQSAATTTEAAREIGLSTKQQSTAVEQVNIAIASVAQATRETEASATQTMQTASELTGLSRDLVALIKPATRS